MKRQIVTLEIVYDDDVFTNPDEWSWPWTLRQQNPDVPEALNARLLAAGPPQNLRCDMHGGVFGEDITCVNCCDDNQEPSVEHLHREGWLCSPIT